MAKKPLTEQQIRYRTEYLRSDHWQNLRTQALARAEGQCVICGHSGIDNDVHHIWYPPSLNDVEVIDLRVLCRQCHKNIHAIMELSQKPKDRNSAFKIFRKVASLLHDNENVEKVSMNGSVFGSVKKRKNRREWSSGEDEFDHQHDQNGLRACATKLNDVYSEVSWFLKKQGGAKPIHWTETKRHLSDILRVLGDASGIPQEVEITALSMGMRDLLWKNRS